MNLKAYLATINVTMKDFAQKVDCDSRYLSQISKGKIIPGRKLARDIQEATGDVIKFDIVKKDKKEKKKYCKHCNQEL
jgi:transcriptional regulator with XRE-family HTH domain